MITMLKKAAICSSVLLISSPVLAAKLTGEISFTKKPPHAGIIYVTGGSDKVKTAAKVDQKDKDFTRRVIPVSTGQSITFTNSDSVDHNIFSQDRKSGVKFDVGLMPKGGSSNVDVSWDKPGLIRIGCKIHPKMRAYIANIPSDVYATFAFRDAKAPYTFSLGNLPENAKEVVLSIPGYEQIALKVTENMDANVEIKRKGKVKGSLKLKSE